MQAPRFLIVASILTSALVGWVGCGGAAMSERAPSVSRVATAARVAVLPSTWITEPMLASSEVDATFARALASRGTLEVAAIDGPARTGADRDAERPTDAPVGCDEDSACLRAWGVARDASRVAHARLAGLGSTVVVRARLVDVSGHAREQTQEEVVQNATRARVRDAVTRLGVALTPAPALDDAEPEAWYDTWWLWTIVGAVVVGAAVAIILVATTANDRNPDFIITPP